MHDLVIRGGAVVDGTGAAARTADVAVSGARIVDVGDDVGRGRVEIDADGAIVAPGFVDVHTHYDGQATWESRLQPSSWHGVTTVVMGNCGVGFAPALAEDRQRLIELMEGVEDIPGTALHIGLDWEWETFPEYLDALARLPHDMDLAAQVPHAAIRVRAMRDRAIAGAPATAGEIATMARLAREGIEAGALGFSTSRTAAHRSISGELTPSYDVQAAELVAIAAELGAGVFQLVSDFGDMDAEFDLVTSIARTGRPVTMLLAQGIQGPRSDSWREILDRIADANALGMKIVCQVAARGIGLLLGLPCTLHPFMVNPEWRKLAHLPVSEQARAMSDPAVKAAILAAQTDEVANRLGASQMRKVDAIYELTDPPTYEPDPSQSIAAIAARMGRTPLELMYDLMIQDDGQALLYLIGANWADQSLDPVRAMLLDPNTIPGLSDAGAHVGTLCDGSYPTTLLEYWARDRAEGLALEFVIDQQARQTSRFFGLHDRGVIAPGYKADLNVIDMERLRVRRPELHNDLPGGAPRLLQRADGYLHTFVSGRATYVNGEATDELPGRLVRGAQPAPAGAV